MMKLFFWRKNNIEEAPKRTAFNDKNIRNFIVKAVGLIARQGAGRENFDYPEYDLEEIKIASLSDSYIKQALMKYSYLIYKAGYNIKSENEEAAEYIRTRFRIMSFATQTPIDITFQEVADDLVRYSNAFLVKSRVDFIMPGIKANGIFGKKPVGGYFRVDPATMRIKRDKNGRVLKYQQVVDGESKEYQPYDVVHFYLDREANNAFGTPRIIAALEDVKLLRKIEGNIVSLIYRFAIPIYQWIVGLPEPGFQATEQEIEDAKAEIEKSSLDGAFVTNERTQIKAIGVEGHALDASGYLEYFEKRVFTALGVSESQMGRGGNKQDADSMEAQAHDTVKYIQRTLSIFIENYIINELLLEGGFNPILNEKDIVRYEFEETSLETKVKLENHELLKFQSNVISLEEVRRNIGKKEEVDEDRLYANVIDKQNAIDQIREKTKGTIEIMKAKDQVSDKDIPKNLGVQGNGQVKSAKPNDDVFNRNMPANQYGRTSVKIKESLSENMPDLIDNRKKDKESHKKTYSTVYKKYEDMRNDIVRNPDSIDFIIPLARDYILKEVKDYMYLSALDGANKAIKDLNKDDLEVHADKINLSDLERDAQKTITKLLKDIRSRIRKGEDPGSVIDILEYRLRFLLEYIIPKSFWYSYVKTVSQLGVKKVYIDFDGSHDKNDHPSVIDTNNFDWENDIPAYHPFCDCKVVLKKAGDTKK